MAVDQRRTMKSQDSNRTEGPRMSVFERLAGRTVKQLYDIDLQVFWQTYQSRATSMTARARPTERPLQIAAEQRCGIFLQRFCTCYIP